MGINTQWALIALLFCNCSGIAMALTSSDRDNAINAYNDAFYHEPSDRNDVGYYFVNTTRNVPEYPNFWTACEQIEALEDAYQRTNNPTYQGMITKLVNGLNQVVSKDSNPDWAHWNSFNDDIMWGVIALARAYELTGRNNNNFLDQAQVQFKRVWSRGWDAVLGGGLWWTSNKESKNACVNFPAIIAAMYLARNTQNTGYRSQADQLWTWSRDHLYNKDTGQVSDNMKADGTLQPKAYTYNQGTFIGAAYMLYLDTKQSSYLDDCFLASTYTKDHLTTSGIIDNNETGGADGPGFKGIFARWCSKYAKQVDNAQAIKSWLTVNADTAWNNRNSANLMSTTWQDVTPNTDLSSWECSSGLSITQNAP